MGISLTTAAALAGLLLGVPAPKEEDPVKAEMKALEGTWQVIDLQENGRPVGEKDLVLVIVDGKLEVLSGGQLSKAYTITIDPAKKPKTIDLTSTKDKDRQARGIYKLEGDQLTICLEEGTDKRPADFKSGEKRSLVSVKRVKR